MVNASIRSRTISWTHSTIASTTTSATWKKTPGDNNPSCNVHSIFLCTFYCFTCFITLLIVVLLSCPGVCRQKRHDLSRLFTVHIYSYIGQTRAIIPDLSDMFMGRAQLLYITTPMTVHNLPLHH
ncbi:hypothetical protein Y032_0094g2742 [Ancylostoma ceylanicum]|uniref:Uncharacterized protein n=1 Tax=Ancylostoma ceylanicum TaxID=53326 RepID=A0A016TL33_9BILA|nr:hypothetical protein Y032_0094g2742 [Ancylostoma ceylanicum]